MSEPIIGINIEDNYIAVGLVNIETRKVVTNSVQRKRVNPAGTVEQISTAWNKAIADVAGNSKKIGVGLPGACDYEAGIWLMNETNRYDSFAKSKSDLKTVFASAIGASRDDVKLMNDAACFLQGEVFGGSGRGFKSSLGVTLGVGLGTAIYANGVVTDANLHSTPYLDSNAEDYISIRGILKRFKELSGIEVSDLPELRQYADTNPHFTQVFEEFAGHLANFLESFIGQHNPEVVVVGGFMEIYNRFFFDSMGEKLVAKGVKIPILRATLGEQASIIGAASCWYSATAIHAG